MAALSVTPAQVAYVSGPTAVGAVAGEAFTAGASVYYDAATQTWKNAQCDGTAPEAGQDGNGIALFTADAAGARGTIALPGAIVTLGAGAAPAAGTVYVMGATAGRLDPVGDMVSTNKVTVAAIGRGSNQIQVLRGYDAGAIVP